MPSKTIPAMPANDAGTAWIQTLAKEELEEKYRMYEISEEGTIGDLRKVQTILAHGHRKSGTFN